MKQLLFAGFILLFFAACDGGNNSKESSPASTEKKNEKLSKDEMYTCTMHNEVMSEQGGECPKCGMKLVKQEMTAEQQKMMNEGTYTKPKK